MKVLYFKYYWLSSSIVCFIGGAALCLYYFANSPGWRTGLNVDLAELLLLYVGAFGALAWVIKGIHERNILILNEIKADQRSIRLGELENMRLMLNHTLESWRFDPASEAKTVQCEAAWKRFTESYADLFEEYAVYFAAISEILKVARWEGHHRDSPDISKFITQAQMTVNLLVAELSEKFARS